MISPLTNSVIKELMQGYNFKSGIDQGAYEDRVKDLREKVGFKFSFEQLGILIPVVESMLVLATNRYLGAVYNGASHDGGAGEIISELAGVVVGFEMGRTGALKEPYKTIDMIAKRNRDPQYEEYKKLYSKFGGIDPN